jgi:hypothetical protein
LENGVTCRIRAGGLKIDENKFCFARIGHA